MSALAYDPYREQSGIKFSREQSQAATAIRQWWATRRSPFFHLSGFAGTGKTSLVVALGQELRGSVSHVAFVTPTGKAASVMARKGAVDAMTIHRFLYHRPTIIPGKPWLWERREQPPEVHLIVADECSMIDYKLGRDLLALGIPLLVTGDPFQLPPVNGDPFFNSTPDFILTEVHRQAWNSQPLKLATDIRSGEAIQSATFDRDLFLAADVVIVALNATRNVLNRKSRLWRGIEDRYPIVGDKAICLKNNSQAGVYNGEIWFIDHIDDKEGKGLLRLQLVDDLGRQAEVLAPEHFSAKQEHREGIDAFDFGYCITCHKSQGSEWDHVVVIDETSSLGFRKMARGSGLDPNEFTARWLYTAVTRAAKRVDLMEPPREQTLQIANFAAVGTQNRGPGR